MDGAMNYRESLPMIPIGTLLKEEDCGNFHFHITSNSTISGKNLAHLYQIDKDSLKSGVLSLKHFSEKFFAKPNGETFEMHHMKGGAFTPDGSMLYLINGHYDDNGENGGIRLFDYPSGILLARSRSGSGSFNYDYNIGIP